MSSVGSIKTLVAMLSAFLTPFGISVAYGEELIAANDYKLPMVVVVPVGGPWTQGAYYEAATQEQNNIWQTQEQIDLYLWSADVDANGRERDTATPVDHADAVENLRARVLQALQDQAPSGLMYRPYAGRWEFAQNEVNRYGRGYVLSVQVDISVPAIQPTEVTVDEVTITPEIT